MNAWEVYEADLGWQTHPVVVVSHPARAALAAVVQEAVARRRAAHPYVYVQITRGVAPRDHVFPQNPVRPSLIVTARLVDPQKGEIAGRKGHGHAVMQAGEIGARGRGDDRHRIEFLAVGADPGFGHRSRRRNLRSISVLGAERV